MGKAIAEGEYKGGDDGYTYSDYDFIIIMKRSILYSILRAEETAISRASFTIPLQKAKNTGLS